MKIPIGLQLYSLREQTAQDYAGTLRSVARIGYSGVEFAGFSGLPAKNIRILLEETALKAVGSHVPLEQLQNNLLEVIDYHLEIQCHYLICPWATIESIEACWRVAEILEQIGETCANHGVMFGYHNHAHEFQKFDDQFILDLLLSRTSPAHVRLELDTGFAEISGVDSTTYIRNLRDRCPVIHLKDMLLGASNGTVEIGKGILDVPKIIKACEDSGVTWIVVEQEFFSRPALQSVMESYRYLMGLE